ncbi:MAG TPA: Sec-independent protein translocase protein TatB [Alphaproteobacteria bacterium]|nr:Sec-independent protein translocase protein TatB [Alphaproteobacteria bacterium]
MFGFSWSEIIIIAVVALVVVGPKDLPRAMRTAARWMRAGQKLAREFQSHVDELVREAELEELREKVQKAATTPLASHVEAIVDPDRELTSALTMPDTLAAPPAAETATIHAPKTEEALPVAATAPASESVKEASEAAVAHHDG